MKFTKVSKEQFLTDGRKLMPMLSDEEILDAYSKIELPSRGSQGSAGYDIRTPFSFSVTQTEGPITIPTGLRAEMPKDSFLMIVPRSGIGFKTGVSLANTVGIIDSDYFYSDNEGHIMMKFVPGFKDYSAVSGDRVVQGIFMHYLLLDEDNAAGIRTGGLGSTGVK